MGCFSISGSISNLSISYGDKCVYFPLLPSKYMSEDGIYVSIGGLSQIVANDGPNCYFSPATLPIIGYYNDYGSLENIEEDENTKTIEKFFDCSIQEFVNESIYKENTKDKVLKSMSGMFEHYDIYRTLIEWNITENSLLKESRLNETVLKMFGFQFSHEDENINRFTLIYRFPNIDDYEARCDGKWSRIVNRKTGETYHHIHSLEQLSILWKKLTGIEVKVDQYKNVSKFKHLVDDHVVNLKELENKKFKSYHLADDLHKLYKQWNYFEEIYKESFLMDNETIKNKLVELLHLRNSMYSCNRFFFPAMSGEQLGCNKASKVLLEKSLEIVNEKLKDIEE